MNWFKKISGKYPKKTRFYHASPRRMPVGTMILPARNVPNIKPQYKSSHDYVFLTTDPLPHFTIAPDVMDDERPWHVYEVVPEGRIWPGEWDDIRAEKARVIRYVGNAKGLYLKNKEKRKEQEMRRKEREKLPWNDPNFPDSVGPPPGTSSVDYLKVNERGPYKVKDKHWMHWPTDLQREYREKDAKRLELLRRIQEVGGIPRKEGEPAWYAKVIELLATGNRHEAEGVVSVNRWGKTPYSKLTPEEQEMYIRNSSEDIIKLLEPRAEELKKRLGL